MKIKDIGLTEAALGVSVEYMKIQKSHIIITTTF
jgi:hypothetical protein